ncbi:MAG: hypothetical protein JNJ54_00375 [Myxococcaceae bacterium]|nr:hypothetical protein [Myxococcaceae bacterium]
MSAIRLATFAALVVLAGCRGCGGSVQRLAPGIGVDPVALEFGKVKPSAPLELPLVISSQTQVELLTSSIVVDGPGEFSLGEAPTAIPGLTQQRLPVRFAPTGLTRFEGAIVITSNDPENSPLRVPVGGEGATPVLVIEPRCDASTGCRATVTATPPRVDFAPEAFARRLPGAVPTLPALIVRNDGPVELLIDALSIAGADARAFTFVEPPVLPLRVAPQARTTIPLRFSPLSETQLDYRAEVIARSDDVLRPEVRVPLAGALRPNLAPRVCLNVVRVVPSDGSAPRDYSGPAHWAPLVNGLADAGFDLRAVREIQPRSDVTLSALSSADETDCTTDPEDGRLGLTWQWRVLAAPAGTMAPPIAPQAPGLARLLPLATGAYTVELTVADAQGHTSVATVTFEVALKRDLVAQLSWSGFSDVDLDLHLVRPSSAPFSFFSEGDGGTAGDLNGYAALLQQNLPGTDFDWGLPGAFDDPRLNLDDIGTGQLIETASLNYPEHDARCDAGVCTYRVMAHVFADRRRPDAGCTVGGACRDGERCDCVAGQVCVADEAPKTSAPIGAGRCVVPAKPVLRLFLRGEATPSAVVPLETLTPPDELAVGAPCQLLHLADVEWPTSVALLSDGGRPRPVVVVPGAGDGGYVTSPVLSRFGWRQRGSLQCAPNATRPGGIGWYEVAP